MKSKRNRPAPRARQKSNRFIQAKRSLLLSIVIFSCVLTAAAVAAVVSSKAPKASAAAAPAAVLQTQGNTSDNTNGAISQNVVQQIEALNAEKESRTPAQQKIDSQLIYAIKKERNDPALNGILQNMEIGVNVTAEGGATIDITAEITEALLAELRASGATIVNSFPQYHSMRVQIGLDRLEGIAALPEVTFIQPEQRGEAWREGERAGTSASQADDFASQNARKGKPSFNERASRVRSFLSGVLAQEDDDRSGVVDNPSGTNTGSVNSEGDRTHQADRARGTFNVNGSGIRIGVLSDGARGLAEAQARGDLPPDLVILPGQAGSPTNTGEGTAMLEIIYDLAPGAKLYFASANGGPAQFAQNIRDLRTAGCDVIVDDVFYFNESPFHDGQTFPSQQNLAIITQGVNDVTNAGALYFSSAGNAGNFNDFTSGVWEGDYVNGGNLTVGTTTIANVNDFNGTAVAGGLSNGITAAGSGVYLFWSDPLNGASNDYDLYILNSTSTSILASSTNIQNGTQDPIEGTTASAAATANNRIVVAKKTGSADRYLHINTVRGRLQFNTTGQIRGHATAALAYGVAATPASIPNGASVPGPFPFPFNSSNVVEPYSSDGPRRLFYNPDGTAKTPGNFSSTGGELRQKPDITAADGVMVTGAGGFSLRFFGTSAAAPHGAAIAGLLLSSNRALTQAQVRAALNASATDIEAPGTDRDSGSGIVDAFRALQASGAPGFANLEVGTVTATENGGNGNGFVEPGERGRLTVQLNNTGVADATNITAQLTSTTPGVTVTPPGTATYPNIPQGGSGTNTPPFDFVISSNAGCLASINFTLTLTYTGGATATKTINFTLNTGPQANVNETLDATPPASGTNYTATTGTQTGRIARTGSNEVSNCSFNKPNPGLNDTLTRRDDIYTFQNTSPVSSCVTVSLTSSSGTALQVVAYAGSFNPANPSQNYLGDAGASNNFTQFSVLLPANTNLVVVVNEVAATPASNPPSYPYNLQVSGIAPACAAAPANQPPVNTVPGAQTTNQNTPLVFSAATNNQISVADPDAGNNPLLVTLTATGGTITLNNTTGLTFTNGTGTNSSTVTFTGNTTDINNALNGLRFNPTQNFSGAASLQITTNDQGFTGSGGAQTDTDTIAITVNPGGTIQFSAVAYSVNENAGTATITVTRTGGSSGSASINYASSDGTATAGADYTATSGTLIFADGETSKTFTVPIINDSIDETNETVNLTLTGVSGTSSAGAQATAVLTIIDDDATPTLSINNVSVTEGNSGTNTTAAFTVTLSAASGLPVTVDYTTLDGTASEAGDYIAAAGSLRFNPGETSKTINVTIVGDNVIEPNETFFVILSNPTNATISQTQGMGTITNDDSAGVFAFSSATYAVGEGDSSVQLTVNRTVGTLGAVAVDYATSDADTDVRCDSSNGLASERCDYATTRGTLNFAEGETSKTFTVMITDDLYVEGAERFNVTLGNAVNGSLGAQSTATVTINNNDTTQPTTNPLDDARFFVRQQYRDFLNREPDQGGFDYWTNQITQCGSDQTCVSRRRRDVSAAFFIEQEFQQTGAFVYRFYKASFGIRPTFVQFFRDRGNLRAGSTLEADKLAFALDFVQRDEFQQKYLSGQSAGDFIDALLQTVRQSSGIDLRNRRAELLAEFNAGANETDRRARVVRKLTDYPEYIQAEFNPSFVLMEYFGYLRRDPEEAGFNFWLDVLNNRTPGNFRSMVCAFITSREYQLRFSPVATRTDRECQ